MGRHFSSYEKDLMKMTQFNRCAICGKPLPEDFVGHAIYRSHEHWLHGEAVCPECHKKTLTYGRRRRKPGDPLYPLVD